MCINLDIEVAIEAKAHIPNISMVVNNYLKEYLEVKRNSVDSNEETLRNEIIKLKARAADIEAELKHKEDLEGKKRGKVSINF